MKHIKVKGGNNMAVKLRRAGNRKQCNSCLTKTGRFYEIGIGKKSHLSVVCLCDECIHTLLQKLVVLGSEENEV